MKKLQTAIVKLLRWMRVAVLRITHGHVNWPRSFFVGSNVFVSVTDNGDFTLGNGSSLSNLSQILVKYGRLSIGKRVHIGIGTVITCRDKITIGDGTLIAEYVTIRDQDHRFGVEEPITDSGFETDPILIGSNVWLGAKATITKGVKIGDNSVIGAGAVVTSDIPPNSVAAGVPAKVIRTLKG